MYIEKRKAGNNIKYYLVHSYRINNKVRKIRIYLGINLSTKEIKKEKQIAELKIKNQIDKLNTEIFRFSLTAKQIEKLNILGNKFDIHHLENIDWNKFTEQFTYNTNAIEGSTVRLEEIKEILNKSKTKDIEELETKGVAKAVEFIRKTKEELSLKLIKKLHKLCFDKSKKYAGEIRNVEVIIRNGRGEVVHSGIPVVKLDHALKELIDWYNKNKNRFKPLVLAAIIHNQFEHVHPFQDGNGRVGRLILNYILIKNKYPPINISLEDRMEYYESLREYSVKNNLKPTIIFLIIQYNKTLRQVTTKRRK